MKALGSFNGLLLHIGLLALFTIFILSGCATTDYVGEQVNPLADRLSQTEALIKQLGGRMTTNESKLSSVESKLGNVDAKTEQALAILDNLKLERRLVIDMKEGANFEFNSAALQDKAKQEIDEFLSNLDGDIADAENAIFLVAGHTDNTGSDDYNYELGKRRADTVSRYMVTQKKIDSLQVVTVSYGEDSPITGNDTSDGRARNRRVEILVYQEAIGTE